MLNAVDFLSDEGFAKLKAAPNLAIISIGDPGSDKPKALAEHERLNPNRVLRVEFIDLELEDVKRYGLSADQLCSRGQIKSMLEFIDRLHTHKDLLRLIVHRRMGISLSASVALLAHMKTECWFPRIGQAKTANKNILRLGAEALGKPVVFPLEDTKVS